MKQANSMKMIGLFVALLAVLTLATPGYSWTHDNDFGRSQNTGYHYYHGGPNHGFRHHSDWGNGYRYSDNYYPYYRPYYFEPLVSPGFSLIIPGFSFYMGP